MQAATHIAGAALTAAIARGFGLEIGPPEVLALVVGSLLPDIDTTTSGVGKFLKPASRWIESKYGHRTVTHSLLFAVLVSALLLPLGANLCVALFLGICSHLLLDTLNVNGVPLLWPVRLMFWFMPGRSMRIRYGSTAETSFALVCVVVALVMWPLTGDGFSTAFRRLVASPETAVADYIDLRQDRDVWAQVNGFNRETQEPMDGKYRIIEAIGRSGVLVEDEAGHAYQVSQYGQIVASRIRAYGGAPSVWKNYRLDVGSRILNDVLTALPAGASAIYLTGVLELSGTAKPPPAEVGTFARVATRQGTTGILELHAARPLDLAALENQYIKAGSIVVRAEFKPGQEVDSLPLAENKGPSSTVQSISIDALPSLAGLLVQPGDDVLEGEALARYVRPADTAQLDAQTSQKTVQLKEAQAQRGAVLSHFRALKRPLEADAEAAQQDVKRFEALVAADAATRVELEQARARARAAASKLDGLAMQQSTAATNAEARARALDLDLKALSVRRDAAAAAQVVRSPVAGHVVEIRNKAATVRGLSVDVVILSKPEQTAPSAKGTNNEANF
jgi:membrane-bound metal-dependent hydrolase YbcI (DUF457 family)